MNRESGFFSCPLPFGDRAVIAFIAATLIAQTGQPQPAPQATPLREVVYNFSEDDRTEYSTDQTGTGDAETTTATNTLAAPPASSLTSTGYHGTITVDILQVDGSGFIKAEMHETTNAENGANPFDAVFIVRPDGGLARVSGSDDVDMTTLMAYFGTQYFASHDLSVGTQWLNQSVVDAVEYDTTTTVTAVSGNNVSIASTMKMPHSTVSGTTTVNTSLVYNAAKLVPITLDVRSIHMGSGTTSSAEQTAHYHFDRVSDTLDPSH